MKLFDLKIDILKKFDEIIHPIYGNGPLGAEFLLYGNKCTDTARCQRAFSNEDKEKCIKILSYLKNSLKEKKETKKVNELINMINNYYKYEYNINTKNIINNNSNIIYYTKRYKTANELHNKNYKTENFFDSFLNILEFIDNQKLRNLKVNNKIKNYENLYELTKNIKKYCNQDLYNIRLFYNLNYLGGE